MLSKALPDEVMPHNANFFISTTWSTASKRRILLESDPEEFMNRERLNSVELTLTYSEDIEKVGNRYLLTTEGFYLQ